MSQTDNKRFDRLDQRLEILSNDVRAANELRDKLPTLVSSEIEKQFQRQRDAYTGFRKLGEFLKTWSLTAVVFTVPVALLVFAMTEVSKNSEFRGATAQRLTAVEKSMERLEKTLERLQLKTAAARPTDPGNQAEVKAILARAVTQKSISIIDAVDAGERFISAGNPSAWNIGMQFIGYRSQINADLPSPTAGLQRQVFPKWTSYFITDDPPKIGTRMFGNVATKDAAYAFALRPTGPNAVLTPYALGQSAPFEQPNEDQERGPAIVLMFGKTKDASITLDDMSIKNMVFQDLLIIYSGKPTRLNNVLFVNCRFEFAQRDSSMMLARKILTDNSVSFGD